MIASKHLVELGCVALPKLANGGMQLVTNIALIGFLDPVAFGKYALCFAAIMLIDGALGSAIDLGVIRLAPELRQTDQTRSFGVEGAALWTKIVIIAVAGLVLVAVAEPLGVLLFHEQGQTRLLFLTYGAVVSTLILRSCLVHLQVDLKFAQYGIVEWSHTFSRYGGAAALFFLYERSIESILTGFVAGPAIAVLISVAFFAGNRLWMRVPSFRDVRALFTHLTWFAPATALGTLRDRMDVYFLTLWSSVAEVGIYSAARAVAMVAEVVGMYISIVVSPRIMRLRSEKRFYPFFKAVQAGLIGVSILGAIVVYTGVHFLADALVPEEYMASVPVFELLIIPALAAFAAFPLVAPFVMFVRPRTFLILDVLSIPFLVIGFALTIEDMGAMGAAWVLLVVRSVHATFFQLYAWSLARNT